MEKRYEHRNRFSAFAFIALIPPAAHAEMSAEELAKLAQNPVGNLISLPFQNNTNLNFGPLKKTQNILNIQPVIPIDVSPEWNIITRTIVPVASQPALFEGDSRTNGIGPTNFSAFLSPADPKGGVIWGAGPIVQIPTTSDSKLGSYRWGLGPSFVILHLDEKAQRNLLAIEVPKLGSFIASGNWTAKETGLETFPREDWPPVLIPFFAFRIMVGMGLIMLAVSWFGNFLRWRGRLETTRWFLWGTFLAFPTGFIAVLMGWFTAEVGRQPWVVYGVLRTKDAVTPALTTGDVLFSLAGYVLVYAMLGSFGYYYIFKLLREGPTGEAKAIPGATGSRPLAFADSAETATGSKATTGG